MAHYTVAIIGAGFCGTMVATHLSRLAPAAKIALIDRNPTPGPGLAYGTTDPGHLLNVRAGQMGAFPDAIDDFSNWLTANGHPYSLADFAPRQLYGQYLQHTFEKARAANPNLSLLTHRITAIQRIATGYELTTDSAQKITVGKVVLALGNFPPDPAVSKDAQNPYNPAIWHQLADDQDVLIVGTGLTSLDLIVTLAKTKSHGKIHLLSRHGFLPQEHADPAPPYTLTFDPAAIPPTARALMRAIRAEIKLAAGQGASWHRVIDALRPLNQKFWQSFALEEKQRFLRHLRAYWDVHRHRCAAQIMDAYRMLESDNRLFLHHGPLLAQTATQSGWQITWRPRGTAKTESFTVAHIVRCTGPQSDFAKLNDPLVQNLLHAGLIIPDPLHLGIATAEDYTVIGAQGRSEGLYALGNVLKGRLYESVAVPELRQQAAALACIIAG